jgi:hypothetical protein
MGQDPTPAKDNIASPYGLLSIISGHQGADPLACRGGECVSV